MNRHDPDLLTRRAVMARAAALLGVLMLPDLLRPGEAKDETPPAAQAPGFAAAKSLILLYMAGGMSHLDTLDPKPGRPVAGGIAAIPTAADGVQIGQHLPNLAKLMDRCALIRSLTSTQGAHEQGSYYVHTSYLMRGTARHASLGSWAGALLPRRDPTLPAYVSIAGGSRHPGAGFLPADCAPLPIGDPARGLANATPPHGVDAARHDRRMVLLTDLAAAGHAPPAAAPVEAYHQLYAAAIRMMGREQIAAFDIGQEPEAVKTPYGDDAFGKGCLLARRLVEHGVRTVEVQLGGWDTHDDNDRRVQERCAILDRGLSALIADLAARNLLGTTLVAVISEFGRTPKINQHEGRDHHPACFSALLAGGGVRGGRVHGASDEDGAKPARDPVEVPDFNATLAHALGCDLHHVLKNGDGRPFTVADKGKPVLALFA